MTDIPARASRFIPWIFVGGMLLVIAVNGGLIYFALSSWSGMAVSHAYERGLAYNAALAAATRQEALGWSLNAKLDRQPSATDLVIEAKDRDGKGLGDLQVEAVIERPVGRIASQRVVLQAAGNGIYKGRVASLAPGQWEVRIAALHGSDAMYVSPRLIMP